MIDSCREPWKAVLACLLSISLAACSTARPQYTWHDLGAHQPTEMIKVSPPSQKWGRDAEEGSPSDPVIAPGFLVNMRSVDDTKLNGDYRVDFDGNLQLPYDVNVNTNGLTLSQLEKKLNDTYRPYFKTGAGIRLHVQDRKYWVDVRGLVEKPGRYLVDRNASLDQVMTSAGGLSKETAPSFVHIQKGSKSMLLALSDYFNKSDDKSPIASWTGGETVVFQKDVLPPTPAGSTYHVPTYMLGEVRKPGEYPVRVGSDFIDLLSDANGFTADADLSTIEVVRRTGGRLLDYSFSWNDVAMAPTPMEGDVFFIHADHETKSERHLILAITILTAIGSIATAAVVAEKL